MDKCPTSIVTLIKQARVSFQKAAVAVYLRLKGNDRPPTFEAAVATRTQLEAAIDMLREGDKLVVTKLDRLARSVAHMGDLLEQIEAKGAGLVILSMGNERVDTSTATGKLILNMMVSVAQFEREMMKERQVEGIKRAQAEGKYKGRVPKAMNQADKVKALVAVGVDRVKIQEQLGMSKASYYRCLKVA